MPEVLTPAERRTFDQQFAAIRRLDPGALIPSEERYRHDIRAVAVGGFLRFGGATYLVEEVARYFEASEDHSEVYEEETWTELKLFCLDTGRTSYLEWEVDDEVQCFLTERSLSFANLRDDGGEEVDEDDLDTLADAEESLFLDRTEFEYDDDYAAVFERGGKRENVYCWEFAGPGPKSPILTVEEWKSSGGEDYQIWLSEAVDPDEITVLVRGEG